MGCLADLDQPWQFIGDVARGGPEDRQDVDIGAVLSQRCDRFGEAWRLKLEERGRDSQVRRTITDAPRKLVQCAAPLRIPRAVRE